MWQQFASFASQVVRLYVGTGHVEMEYTIGPIPIRYSDAPCFVLINCCHSDNKGKEVISRYATTMATNKMWYTDANGREMKLRVCVFWSVCAYLCVHDFFYCILLPVNLVITGGIIGPPGNSTIQSQ